MIWGTPIFGNTHIFIYIYIFIYAWLLHNVVFAEFINAWNNCDKLRNVRSIEKKTSSICVLFKEIFRGKLHPDSTTLRRAVCTCLIPRQLAEAFPLWLACWNISTEPGKMFFFRWDGRCLADAYLPENLLYLCFGGLFHISYSSECTFLDVNFEASWPGFHGKINPLQTVKLKLLSSSTFQGKMVKISRRCYTIFICDGV